MKSPIQIAAELVRGDFLPSYFPEDMPKSTPKNVLRMIEDAHNHARELGVALAKQTSDNEREEKP